MIDVCLFDMGGVVTRFSSAVMEQRLLSDFGKNDLLSFENANPLMRHIHHDFLCGLITDKQFWDVFQRLTCIRLPQTEKLYTKYFMPEKNTATVALIRRLRAKKIRVVGASNAEPPHRAWHTAHKDYDIFDAVYTSDTIHFAKPDPMFYIKIAEQENKNPEQLFFTDDNPENIEAAEALGLSAFLFTTAEALEKHLLTLGLL
ncbi:HAD family hydrolase [Treponema socranskii]|uniref:HAD family hydrolase n=1 Tax=Treponema socranskii TaxID=53419 RepID=UPI003D70115E